MSKAFADVYKATIYKENAQERLIQIDFLINDLMGRMAMTLDPSQWNLLLDQREALQIERQGIVDSLASIVSNQPTYAS